MSVTGDQVLVFDADDTLWENNVLFERVIDGFLDWVAATPDDRPAARALLDRVEAANAKTLGYGAAVFRHNLAESLEQWHRRTPTAEDRDRIDELLVPLTSRTVELIPGVADTLAQLAGRHRLLMLTKGDEDEQRRKVEESSIAHHFDGIHIVAEKDVDTYRRLVAESSLPAEHTWMIGNSPKSDIIPARRAGLNAVFIPHEHTWVLEHEEFGEHTATLQLPAFPELLAHF
ncbi:HAD family hydrolase [Kitasatospora aburaviensis]|uniref:HAD family hydrolase n=1 Tax=Kitasatospora aburaviensis TaxID=67265 RepID=A0ABW1F911_9ACTN